MGAPAIWWVRRDLRLADNPALVAAATSGAVIPVFILDEWPKPMARPRNGGWASASRRWPGHSRPQAAG